MNQEKVVEVKWLPLAREDLRDSSPALSDALRSMAYSLRGNNDRAYRIVLVLYGRDLGSLPDAERDVFFRLAQRLARTYWTEFSWTDENAREQPGYERFQIWIEAGGPKATPTLFLDRLWCWGEDGTVGKGFGELEYSSRIRRASHSRDEVTSSFEPVRSTYHGVAFWKGQPHLARARAVETNELYAVPSVFLRPFFRGFVTPFEEAPFLSWEETLRRHSTTAEKMFASHVAQYLPMSPDGVAPQVRWHISTDRETYLAPGGGLYAFGVAAKTDQANPTLYFAYQPTTQDPDLTNQHLREVRSYGGVQNRGRCLLWKTVQAAYAISPQPAFPFGPYYSLRWLYSGLLRKAVERAIDSGLESVASLEERQNVLNAELDALALTTHVADDELEAVEPSRFAHVWEAARSRGLIASLRRRFSSELSAEAQALYGDSFLGRLARLHGPPLDLRKASVIARPDGKPIVNLVRNIERDFGRR